jgi:hypothetical protein
LASGLCIRFAFIFIAPCRVVLFVWLGFEVFVWLGFEIFVWSGFEVFVWLGFEVFVWLGFEAFVWSGFEAFVFAKLVLAMGSFCLLMLVVWHFILVWMRLVGSIRVSLLTFIYAWLDSIFSVRLCS